MSSSYDCCILGAGIAGTTSALVLAQLGLRVLVVEEGRHPRFAIGESLVPTTTLGFDYLARTYGIPELRQISHYPAMKELELAAWPKLGFWFGYQRDGHPLETGHELMFISPRFPLGPDVHMLRADVDGFLASRLASYGVEYCDLTSVVQWQTEADRSTLMLESQGQRRSVVARIVLDCSGHKSFVARCQNLREAPTRLRTNTRTIFSHFHNVRFLEDIFGRPCARFGIRRDACTVHHCFHGGWFWIIRFDNGISSVGLVLDRSTYPDNDRQAADEFWSFVNRFPTVQAQLAGATATRPLVKSGRVQFTSQRIFGERYLLAPHAASFVDPLFSTGMDLTVAFIARMAPVVASVAGGDGLRIEPMRALDDCHHAEINGVDRIVHGMLCSLRSPDVFKQYWRGWVTASLLQYFVQLAADPADESRLLAHYGASLPVWNRHMSKLYQAVTDDTADRSDLARHLKATMDGFPEPYDKQRSNWEIGSTEACCPVIRPDEATEWFRELVAAEPVLAERTRADLLAQSQARFRTAEQELVRRYQASVAAGSPFHQGVDFILAQQF